MAVLEMLGVMVVPTIALSLALVLAGKKDNERRRSHNGIFRTVALFPAVLAFALLRNGDIAARPESGGPALILSGIFVLLYLLPPVALWRVLDDQQPFPPDRFYRPVVVAVGLSLACAGTWVLTSWT